MVDFLLPLWNPLIVHPLTAGLRLLAEPLNAYLPPGLAGGVAIILFTFILRVILLPLSLAQVRSQKAQLAVQPQLRELQRKFKGDREGMARAQMALYKERGVNPMAGCLPLLAQMPILIGMYSAMLALSTQGLTIDQAHADLTQPGRATYEASRSQEPLPHSQFLLASAQITLLTDTPVTLDLPQEEAAVSHAGTELLGATQSLTLTPGQPAPQPGPPNSSGRAGLFLRPGGELQPDGSVNRGIPVERERPFRVDVDVNAPQTNVDRARFVLQYDPALVRVSELAPPPLEDLAFKSRFLWLSSLGEPDLIRVGSIPIPGLLLIIMTLFSFVSQRMMTMPSDDPQQQAMMRSMAFMPLMYLFFFSQTPSGLVLYWLTTSVFQTIQQYFTIGLGTLADDLRRLTGRDFQPAWAHVPTTYVPAPNGRVGAEDTDNKTARARSERATGSSGRRARIASKGRKRGKR